MSPSRWHRSLYWRVALGLFAFLALMLAAEGALFLWVTDRIAGSMPARSPRRLAVLVASDVQAALTRNPDLDLPAYLREQYSQVFQTFLVIRRDGRVASNHDDVPADVLAAARVEAELLASGRRGRGRGDGPVGGPGGPPDGDRRRRAGTGALGEVALIMVDQMPVGRVVVLPGRPPFWRVVRQLGPTVGLVAGGVLLVGTALIAFVVFGPARHRLKAVQSAAERVGAGDLAARAPDYGGDEVAALSRSFNRMADELAARAQALTASDKARRQLLADVSHEL